MIVVQLSQHFKASEVNFKQKIGIILIIFRLK
jgi:hypothetical protein